MCKLEELSNTRKQEIDDIIARGIRTKEWCEAALSLNSSTKWESSGFGCFVRTPEWFEVKVGNLLKSKETSSIEELQNRIEVLENYMRLMADKINELEGKI